MYNRLVLPLVAASAWWILACDAAVRGDLTGYDRASSAAIEIGASGLVEMDMAVVAHSQIISALAFLVSTPINSRESVGRRLKRGSVEGGGAGL